MVFEHDAIVLSAEQLVEPTQHDGRGQAKTPFVGKIEWFIKRQIDSGMTPDNVLS